MHTHTYIKDPDQRLSWYYVYVRSLLPVWLTVLDLWSQGVLLPSNVPTLFCYVLLGPEIKTVFHFFTNFLLPQITPSVELIEGWCRRVTHVDLLCGNFLSDSGVIITYLFTPILPPTNNVILPIPTEVLRFLHDPLASRKPLVVPFSRNPFRRPTHDLDPSPKYFLSHKRNGIS